MRFVAYFTSLCFAGWCAVGGIVALITHRAVMECLVVELAAIALTGLGAVLLVDDLMGPRS